MSRHHQPTAAYACAVAGVRWATRAQRLVPLVVYDGCRHDSELHAVLTGSVMIRRLKSQVLSQLPKLIRTVVRVAEKGGKAATTSTTDTAAAAEEEEPASLWDDVSSSQAEMIRDEAMMLESEAATGRPSEYHLVGRSKLAGALEWVSEWLQRARLLREGEEGRKLVLFGYHLDVLDGLQKRVQEVLARQQAGGRRRKKRGKKKDEEEGDEEDDEEEDDEEVADEGAGGKPLSLIRIDGHVPGQGRQALVAKFRDDPHCIVAIIGITAGGVGAWHAFLGPATQCESAHRLCVACAACRAGPDGGLVRGLHRAAAHGLLAAAGRGPAASSWPALHGQHLLPRAASRYRLPTTAPPPRPIGALWLTG